MANELQEVKEIVVKKLKYLCKRIWGFLKRRGIFGKRIAVLCYLHESGLNESKYLNRRTRYNNEKFDKQCDMILSRYKQISIHFLWSTRIGEFTPRCLEAINNKKNNSDSECLDIFVLSDYKNVNTRLLEIIGRNIYIVDEKNIDFWVYMINRCPKLFITKNWSQYRYRNSEIVLDPLKTAEWLKLTEDEEAEGRENLSLMGVSSPYICIQNRDSRYLEKAVPDADYTYHNYRDSSINNFELLASHCLKKSILLVRMGRFVKDKALFENCIDYANDFYNEFMDVFLIRNCKFYIGSSAGLYILSMALNVRTALVNIVPILRLNLGSFPQRKDNLFIIKKYFSQKENRFLTLNEMFTIEKEIFENKNNQFLQQFSAMGIDVMENTSEEILDLAMEMDARIDGTWKDTEQDIQNQKKFHDLLIAWGKKENIPLNTLWKGGIGAMFLRKNAFLLSD